LTVNIGVEGEELTPQQLSETLMDVFFNAEFSKREL